MKLLRSAAFLVAFTALLVVGKTTSHLSPGPHVTDVNILLPPKMTRPVEYRLQGSDGCFKWSWDHHDILSVIPEYNASNSQCSTSARLRSIAPFTGRKETAIYAADVHTGIVIRCKVFIDNISRIQIFHNSIKLDLDGLATLRARAFDSEDNVFSSLAGLQFMWQLMPETDGLPHHLVHVPLRDSPLSDCGGLCGDLNIQIELEDSGVFSDLYVVKGVEIGHENVSVHFLEPQFKHLADKIVLTVAEAMSLEPPSPVLVLIGAAFRYTLKVIRGNILQVVALPSPHHRWSVLNSSVAEVDHMSGFAQALSLGVTSVIVEDTRVAGHMQVSSLNVVLPDTLCLYIMPLSDSGDPVDGLKATPSLARWFVVSGRQYLIQMKVFLGGPDAQEIYITESDDLKLHHEQSKYWTIFMLSEEIVVKHGWRNSRILRANSLGLGKMTASLTNFSLQQERKKVLNVVQEIMVCDQVKFSLDGASGTHQTILLPWTPTIYQEVELKATGGCAKTSSDYKWFSSDTTTVSISPFGVLQAKKPGKATVRVVSVFDSSNHDEVVIEVSVPSSMIMLQNFPVETVVGSHLPAAVTMKASDGAYYYRCDAFHLFLKWKVGSESFVIVNATEGALIAEKLGNFHLYESVYGPPCSWTYIYASGPGQTTLQATLLKEYHLDQSFHGSLILKASSRIAAYPPLTVHQVVDGSQFGGYWLDLGHAEASNHLELLESLYLVPGTSLDIMLLGSNIPVDMIYTSALIRAQMTAMLAMTQHRRKKVPIILHNESEQAREWSQIFSEDTKKQSIPVVTAWQLNERMYGELQGLNKQETADRFGKEKVHEWRRSYDIPPPNGESLEMCAERAVAYFKDHIEPQLLSGKNVMIAAHGNSLRSIIMYLDKLTSQEVINLELSTGIPMLYIFKGGKFIRRGSPAGPTEAGVYAYTRRLALYRQKLDEMLH